MPTSKRSRGIDSNPRLALFDLSEKTKKGLYLLGVDCMDDLLQVTEEEFLALEREKGYDAGR